MSRRLYEESTPSAPATITILASIAVPGDVVEVLNYRRRPAEWERAEVQRVDYSLPNASGHGGGWSYHVTLGRRSARGTYMHLHVGEDSIRVARARWTDDL